MKTPEIGKHFTVGIDLKLVRQARVYQLGESTNMGGSFIVEAHDEKQNDLGSFVTSIFPFACTK